MSKIKGSSDSPPISERIDAIRTIVTAREAHGVNERRFDSPKFEKWGKTDGPHPWTQDGFLKGPRS
jgi:hypothetical protein